MVLGTLRISENTGILLFMDRYTLLLYDNIICNESKDDLRWIKNSKSQNTDQNHGLNRIDREIQILEMISLAPREGLFARRSFSTKLQPKGPAFSPYLIDDKDIMVITAKCIVSILKNIFIFTSLFSITN